MSTKSLLRVIGNALLGFGLLVFAFIAYLLWGTSLFEAHDQSVLRHQFEVSLQATTTTTAATTTSTTAPASTTSSTRPSSTTTTGASGPGTTTGVTPTTGDSPVIGSHNPTEPPSKTSTAALGPPPPDGSAIAILDIPAIGVDKAVVQGTSVTDLEEGPGHYSDTPLPGQLGNAAIAGHRTTFGGPFYRLGDLRRGDDILVTTRQGSFRYVVQHTLVVSPQDSAVVAPTATAWLTLTTCTPPFSATSRLVVQATLVGKALPAETWTTGSTQPAVHHRVGPKGSPSGPGATTPSGSPTSSPKGSPKGSGATGSTSGATTAPTTPNSSGGSATPVVSRPLVPGGGSVGGAIGWGLGAALVYLAAWLAWRRLRSWPRLLGALVSLLVLVVVLFFFFSQVNGLLPQGY